MVKTFAAFSLGLTIITSTDGHAAISAPCGDERDTINQEYVTFGVGLSPACSDYTQSAHSEYFTYAELTVQNPHAWALVRQPLTVNKNSGYGLDKWRLEYGSARSATSVFRCPHHNDEVGGATQSRHMYGDAADLRNVTASQAEYDSMSAAATRAAADYIEPVSGPCGLDCVHADWRNHTGLYSAIPAVTQTAARVDSVMIGRLASDSEGDRISAFYTLVSAGPTQASDRVAIAVARVLAANPDQAAPIRAALIRTLARENANVQSENARAKAPATSKRLTERYTE